jgi:hypothetical protein
MYLSQRKRGGLGQDDGTGATAVTPASVFGLATSPVDLQLSPLMIAGIGLLAFAAVAHFARQTTGAVSRKGRAVRKALKA